MRLEFQQRVESARQALDIPDWVKGPRPSDECIASHRDDDPQDSSILEFHLAPMLEYRDESRRFVDVLSPGGGYGPVPAIFQAEKVNARGVACYWASWPGIDSNSAKEGMVLYIHGGGFVAGHPLVNWCAHLSRVTKKPVLTVDYGMAPEHPMPAGTHDVVNAYRWLIEDQLVPPSKIAIYGPSAGATLTMLMMQELARQDVPLPACGVAVSSWSPELALRTQPQLCAVMVGNDDGTGQGTGSNFDPCDEKYNFFAGSFNGLPPIYVMVGGLENVKRDLNCSLRLADVAQSAGVRVELDIVANMQHSPDACLGTVPESTEAVARAAKFIDDCINAC